MMTDLVLQNLLWLICFIISILLTIDLIREIIRQQTDLVADINRKLKRDDELLVGLRAALNKVDP